MTPIYTGKLRFVTESLMSAVYVCTQGRDVFVTDMNEVLCVHSVGGFACPYSSHCFVFPWAFFLSPFLSTIAYIHTTKNILNGIKYL